MCACLIVCSTMAQTLWWADRLEVLLTGASDALVSLWHLHSELQNAATRPEALSRSDVNGMRRYFSKNIIPVIDLDELERVRFGARCCTLPSAW